MNTTSSKRQTRRGLPRRSLPDRSRAGAAAVELALCLPILLTTALGMIETCNVVFLQARMQSAAFEAARLATRPTTSQAVAATATQVIADANTLLTQLGVSNATVTLSPASLSSVTPGTLVTVTITARLVNNSVTCLVLSNSLSLTAQATMIIE
jgi:Flp pilus assembly protein TadG